MKINPENSDKVFHLGTVMIKVIVLFLFGAMAVAIGIIWYRTEVEITENMNKNLISTVPASTTLRTSTVRN